MKMTLAQRSFPIIEPVSFLHFSRVDCMVCFCLILQILDNFVFFDVWQDSFHLTDAVMFIKRMAWTLSTFCDSIFIVQLSRYHLTHSGLSFGLMLSLDWAILTLLRFVTFFVSVSSRLWELQPFQSFLLLLILKFRQGLFLWFLNKTLLTHILNDCRLRWWFLLSVDNLGLLSFERIVSDYIFRWRHWAQLTTLECFVYLAAFSLNFWLWGTFCQGLLLLLLFWLFPFFSLLLGLCIYSDLFQWIVLCWSLLLLESWGLALCFYFCKFWRLCLSLYCFELELLHQFLFQVTAFLIHMILLLNLILLGIFNILTLSILLVYLIKLILINYEITIFVNRQIILCLVLKYILLSDSIHYCSVNFIF